MVDLSQIHMILQHAVQSPSGVDRTPGRATGSTGAFFAADASLVQMLLDLRDTAKLQVHPIDLADALRLGGIDDELAVLDLVTQRNDTTHPHSLTFRSSDLVPDALAGDFAFELSEGEQDVERQPAHGGRGVELLGDGDETDALFVELLDDLRKVGQGTGESIDFVDHNGID